MSRWWSSRRTTARVLAELEAKDGATGYAFRQRLAAKAFARTAAYDAAVSAWFAGRARGDRPGLAELRRAARASAPLWRESAPVGSALPDRRARPGVATRAPGAGQGTLLQQHQRYRRRLRTGRRVRSGPHGGRGDHQARQPLRRRGGRDASPTPTALRSAATRSPPSAASSRSTGRSTPRRRRRSPRSSPK